MARSKIYLLTLFVVAALLALPMVAVAVVSPDDIKAEAVESESVSPANENSESKHVHDDHGGASGEHADAHGHGADYDPLSTTELFKHVQDATYFHVPKFMDFEGAKDGHIAIPQPIKLEKNLWNGYGVIEPSSLRLTKFMVLQVLAALVLVLLFVWFAGRVRDGSSPRGKLANLLEVMVVFVRDDIALPAIGSRKDTDKFLPFLLTMFFFVLAMNLIGMVPFFGASTGSIAVTGALALITFGVVVGSGVVRFGPIGYLANQVPHMDIPVAMAIVLKPMIFAIELFGILVKHFVLAVRLFANMLAGHLVLAVFVAFIHVTAQPDLLGGKLVYGVAPLSILASVALGCLEVLVAFLQAYVFTFLASLFIGSSLHPH